MMTREQEHAVKQQARQAANADDDLGRARSKARAEWWVGELSHKLGIVNRHGMVDVNGEVARAFVRAYMRRPREVWPTPDTTGVREAGGHRVADFNTLDDLIAHAGRELGATHVDRTNTRGPRIYFPSGDGYEVASVWQKGGYWHAQGPSARGVTKHLSRGAQPIEGSLTSKTKSLWKRAVGAPQGRVEDYEAIDRRDRVIAGPFKHYSDAKDAAGPAGAVRFVPSRGKPSKATEAPRAREDGAEEAGAAYAQEQLESDYFKQWAYEQLVEASKLPPSDVLPLEDKHDAMKIARNMLQQLEWDTRRDVHESAEFYKGFRSTLDASRNWLADELLTWKREIHGGSVVSTTKGGPHGMGERTVDPTAWYIDLYDGERVVRTFGPYSSKKEAVQVTRSRARTGFAWGDAYQGMDMGHALTAKEKRRGPKAKRSVRRRR